MCDWVIAIGQTDSSRDIHDTYMANGGKVSPRVTTYSSGKAKLFHFLLYFFLSLKKYSKEGKQWYENRRDGKRKVFGFSIM